MKRIFILNTLLVLLLCATSCIKERETGLANADGPLPVKLSLRVPSDMRGGATTRGIAVEDESALSSVELLAFLDDGGGDFQYVYSAPIESAVNNNGQVEIVATAQGYTRQQVFMVLVNAPAGTTSGIVRNTSLAAARQQLLVTNANEWNAASSGDYKPLPMYAETSPSAITTGASLGNYDLVRMLARIDVQLKAGVSNFEIAEAHLFNRRTSGQMAFPFDAATWNATDKKVKKTTYPLAAIPGAYKPSYYDTPGYASTPYKADDTNDPRGEILRSIYTFESKGVAEADRLDATAVIVGGRYNGSNDVTYYRVDIKTDATPAGNISQDILRNHCYQIEIQSVAQSGYDTPEKAFIGSKPIGVTVKVIDWGAENHVTLPGDGSEIPSPTATLTTDADGAYFPALAEPQTITVTSNTRWIANIKRGSNVVTTGEASALGQPLINTTTGFNGGSENGYIADGTAGTTTVKTFTITPVDYINDPWREAMGDLIIIFRDAETGQVIKETTLTITSGEIQPLSNSYIVKTGGIPILIPVGRANESALGVQIGADDPLTAHFIWSDNANCQSPNGPVKNLKPAGKGSMAYILVIPGAGKGNSVVAVATPAQSTDIAENAQKVGGGNAVLNDPVIRWSWHIWTVDPNDVPGESGTSGWMDRNLGAFATAWSAYVIGDVVVGNYYQWGRKDPLPRGTAGYVNGVLTTMTTTYMGLAISVRSPYSWLQNGNGGSTGTNSWNNGTANYKTVYDPCPKGWRIPLTGVWGTGGTGSNGALGSWGASQNNGRIFLPSGDFWPFTGQRNSSTGFYAIPSGAGYYWSGSAYDPSQAYDLDIGPSYVGVNYRTSHGTGMNIRCIKDPYYTDN